MTTAPSPEEVRYAKRLKVFRDRLLNIDTRNPSVFFRRVVKKSFFDLNDSSELARTLLTRIARGPHEVLLLADKDESEAAQLARVNLVQVRRFSDALTEETGLRELFVGCCWLEGFTSPEVFIRAPLVLAPVRIEHKRGGQRPGWILAFDEPVQVNRALLAALRKFKDYAAPEDLADSTGAKLNEGSAGKLTDDQLFQSLTSFFVSTGLPGAAIVSNPLQPIRPLRVADLQPFKGQPLRFRHYGVLGVFRQSSTALHMDLEEMIRRAQNGETDQGIVDNLLEAPADDPSLNPANTEEVRLDEVPDLHLNLVVPSDPSQDAVVVKAQRADCVVVRGPPGTGKSQVIVNLISDTLSRGERVLLVCQKRAALDVVYDRLREVALSDAAFLVHDERTDRGSLYKHISAVLEQPPPSINYGANLAGLSESIDKAVADIRAIAEPLRSEVRGVRLSTLYRQAETGFHPRINVAVANKNIPDDQTLQQLRAFARRFQPGYARFDSARSPVAERTNWADLGHSDKLGLLDLLQRLAELATQDSLLWDIPDDLLRARMLSVVPQYETLKTRWYRLFLPRWHRARKLVEVHSAANPKLQPADWPMAISRCEELKAAIRSVGKFFRPSWTERLVALGQDRQALLQFAKTARAFVEAHFDELQEHDSISGSAGSLSSILDECGRTLPEGSDWAEHLYQAVNLAWIEEAERRYPTLRGNPLQKYETLRTELQAKIDQKRVLLARHLAQRCRARAIAPEQDGSRRPSDDAKAVQTIWNKLAHEVGKQRRLKPLRALVSEFEPAMRNVAPCWLASPEVVAEVFPLKRGLFDLVIFDEASQLAVERSLPVLYRGKRVVIAGDEQQMPPSHFFESINSDDEGDDDEQEPMASEVMRIESLLMLAKRIYGQTYLGWHYRSQHQELIDFSNHAFYGGTLNVAANVGRASADPPIRWVPTTGVWENNRNAVEVKMAVNLLSHQLRRSVEGEFRSIGIITFNSVQMDAIKDEVERRREVDAEFAEALIAAESREEVDERPFVKNIENVQGDERDVIIFSVGYARDPDNVFRRQFGPISLSGGENRLNVAVTRARRSVFVVCSFDPDYLAVDKSKNLGPVRFRQYLQYAKAVSERNSDLVRKVLFDINPDLSVGLPRQKNFDSPFEEAVYDALVRSGYDVETQVGLSGYRIDLAVVDPTEPTRFCLGIECDGATFHSGRSVRERDLARQRFLEKRGWKIARIWSRNWWLAPDKEIARIKALLPPITGSAPRRPMRAT